MLVIIKQMLLEYKKTFKDFIESDEGIATNILSKKLRILENLEIIKKSKLPNNNKTNLYSLTEKGLALTSIIVDLAFWSDTYLREIHPTMIESKELELLRKDKIAFGRMLEQKYRENCLLDIRRGNI
jgi:DNA-binding HxlR family transcriptional regulator